jgi:hypothetical protein
MHKRHDNFISWFGQCQLHVVVTSFGQGLHSTPLKWSKDQTWVPQFSSLYEIPLWGISTGWSLSRLTQEWGGTRNIHTNLSNSNNTHTSEERSAWNNTAESQLKTCSNLYLMKQQHGREVVELQYAQRMLVYCSMVPRGSFYSPKGCRSRWSYICKAMVAFCPRVHGTARCTTDTTQCNDYISPDWSLFHF